ncbi:MAG: LysR family transcriptional regulator [Vicinamibacterales bacterium]
MDLRDLRAFIAIAEEQSFTRAAERLHMSQPPLTRQIRDLEQELGVTLFRRTSHGAQLTAEGRQLLDRAREIASRSAEFVDLARRLQAREAGVVRIGIGWRLWELVNQIRAHHERRFPEVTIEGHDIYSSLQNQALRTNAIDVGFMRPPVDTTHLNAEKILDEHFVVLLSESHPLACRRSLRIADLTRERLLVQQRGFSRGLHDKMLAIYERAGVKPTVLYTDVGPAQEAGRLPIASGKAIYLATVSPYTSSNFGSGIAVVPLDEPDATLGVYMAWRHGETVQKVLDLLDSGREARDTFSVSSAS